MPSFWPIYPSDFICADSNILCICAPRKRFPRSLHNHFFSRCSLYLAGNLTCLPNKGPQTPPSSCTVFQGLRALMYEGPALLTAGRCAWHANAADIYYLYRKSRALRRRLFSLLPALKVSFWSGLRSGCVYAFISPLKKWCFLQNVCSIPSTFIPNIHHMHYSC